jgi:hypothetical protein
MRPGYPVQSGVRTWSVCCIGDRAHGHEPVHSREAPVASKSLREIYVELLLDRVREENFPNPDHLDRIEATVRSPEQIVTYMEVLLSKVEGLRYPSGAILDRIQRLAQVS